MSEIVEKSQTLVLCKATDGCVFGCFAPCEWHKSAQFYGKDLGGHGSYVFSLSDSARIYKCSGWNTVRRIERLHSHTKIIKQLI